MYLLPDLSIRRSSVLLYPLRYGITPVDLSAVHQRERDRERERAKYEIPPEYADILIG